ncbi:phosphate transporter [Ceratobasidium sp. AG-I]|nr:phosphate transporter [Ceratobasidium sp. AG-I]
MFWDELKLPLRSVPETHNGLTYDERRRAALKEIDDAPFSWLHVKVCAVAGIGFFTDAYDTFAINLAAAMIGSIYGANVGASCGSSNSGIGDNRRCLSENQELGLKIAAPIGTLVGHLWFGWLADMVGRKTMYGVELTIIVAGTFVQALAGHGLTVGIIGVLVIWRFIMGIGIGGDYPLSAVITSEFAATRIRGRMMTAVFSMQGFGNLTACLVALIVTEAFKETNANGASAISEKNVDYCWRLIIGLGAIPGCLALYFRLTIPETPRYTMDIERNVKQATQDVETFLATGTYNVDPDAIIERANAPRASWDDFKTYFGKWKNGKVLLGTAYSWLALDIAFYGLGLNSVVVLQKILLGDRSSDKDVDAYQTMREASVGNLILSAGGLIPGYLVAFYFIDSWGRKPIQFMGFTLLTIIFVCMGFGYNKMLEEAKGALLALYCIANFFSNFGPNTTTFIIPGETFPTRYRSTAHGISAASGKLGAIISQIGFAFMKDIGGRDGAFIGHLFQILAFFMLTGVFSTLLIEETKGRTLEDLSGESQDGFIIGGAGPIEMSERGSVELPAPTPSPKPPVTGQSIQTLHYTPV